MYKIYKIVDNTNGNVYIGKTTQTLKQRLANHKCSANTCISREIIKNGDYKIELIEETDDKTRERYWVENTECINQVIPGRTQQQWYQDNKEQHNAKNKAWEAQNIEKRKAYREKHKEKRRAQMAAWYPENREKRNEKERQRRAKKKLMRNQ